MHLQLDRACGEYGGSYRLAPAAHARSSRTILPSFITNFTRCSSVMSVSGLPETAMMSAYLPLSIDPIRSCQPITVALTIVPDWMARAGDIPARLTNAANSIACGPCG